MTGSSSSSGRVPRGTPEAAGAPAGTVLTVAVTGAHARADVPHLPVLSDEVATAAADCERVGASVVDLEPRHDTALPDVVAAVRARTDLVVRVAAYARSETLATLLDCGAEIVTCPADAPAEFIDDLHAGARSRGLAVHYEVRDLAGLDKLGRLAGDAPVHAVLVFGAGMLADLSTLVRATEGLPPGSGFTAASVGMATMPVLLGTIAAGGHVRVGMADTLEYSPDVPVRDNTQLAARAAGIAKIAQRPPLPAQRTRELFGLASPQS